MKAAVFALLILGSMSAHALSADCLVTAVLDGALPLAQGQSVTITQSGAIIGSTIYRNATIIEETIANLRAIRVIDRGTTIELVSDIHTNEGALYVTALSGPRTQVAQLICH